VGDYSIAIDSKRQRFPQQTLIKNTTYRTR